MSAAGENPGNSLYLPERVVANEALTQFPASTLPLIAEKTGISARRYAADDDVHVGPRSQSRASVPGARRRLARRGRRDRARHVLSRSHSAGDGDTGAATDWRTHPVYAFDVNSVCSGAVFALHVADALIRAGRRSPRARRRKRALFAQPPEPTRLLNLRVPRRRSGCGARGCGRRGLRRCRQQASHGRLRR